MAVISTLSELAAIVGGCLDRPFYGIVITMYYRDHNPPHFHANYGEHQAQIVIATLEPLLANPLRERSASYANGRTTIALSSKRMGARSPAGATRYD